MNNDDVIHYWHEKIQLTNKDENILLNSKDAKRPTFGNGYANITS
jgi:hypothetical protein